MRSHGQTKRDDPPASGWDVKLRIIHLKEINLLQIALKAIGRPSDRSVDNTEMDVGEIGQGDMDWIDVAVDWDRWRALENAVIRIRVS
jgi:hypothetical protein